MAANNNNVSARNFIPMQNKYDRVILLVDMDCFYCQVEEKLNPELKGQPMAVVQYNAWRGGGIIAVNYAARAKGVTRHMRGDEAKEQCPEIQLVKVPNVREKADLSKYREAGKDVANVLQQFTTLLERASVDEAYLDITEAVNKRLEEMNAGTFVLQPQELIDTYAVGYERIGDYLKVITAQFANPYADDDRLNLLYNSNDIPAVRQSDVRLLLGASIVSQIRAAVKKSTGYECSAGIAHNKILAKLACGMNKPNKQTILPLGQVEKLFETLPVGKIKGLGAKFGEEVCEKLKIRFLGQMLKFTESEMQKKFDEKNGSWLYYICRGIDLEAVTPRFYSKSIGCCKKFPGLNNITGLNTLKHWLGELATEISERLEKDICENNRKAKQMTVSYIQDFDGEEISSSRSVPLLSYEQEALAQRSLEVIKTNTKQFFRPDTEGTLQNPIRFLGISAGKFETIVNGQTKLKEMFANQAIRKRKSDEVKAAELNAQEKSKNEKEEESQSNSEEATTSKADENLKYSSKPTSRGSFLKVNEKTRKEKEQQTQSKSFFAKFIQNQSRKADEATTTTTTTTATTNDLEENPPLNKASPTKQSFFMTALNRNVQNQIPQQAAEIVEALPSNDAAILDDVLKLEAELRSLEQQSVTPDSYGSPERKKTRFEDEVPGCNYQSQYAEYAVPELCMDLLEFEKCNLCGAQVPVEERAQQEHRDHHFARELSQQQRQEFHNEIKTKQKKPSPPPQQQQKQKPKLNSTQINKKQKKISTPPSIAKFLKPTSPPPTILEEPSTSSSSSTVAAGIGEGDPLILCEECKLPINANELDEHRDFHFAKQLQRQLNKLEVYTVKKENQNSSSKNVAKKSITQFFTQSSS